MMIPLWTEKVNKHSAKRRHAVYLCLGAWDAPATFFSTNPLLNITLNDYNTGYEY